MPIFIDLPTYRQVFQTGTDIWHICSDISQIRSLNFSLTGAFSAKGDQPLDIRRFPLHFDVGYRDIKVLTDILKHLNCKFWQLWICNKLANVITVIADGWRRATSWRISLLSFLKASSSSTFWLSSMSPPVISSFSSVRFQANLEKKLETY